MNTDSSNSPEPHDERRSVVTSPVPVMGNRTYGGAGQPVPKGHSRSRLRRLRRRVGKVARWRTILVAVLIIIIVPAAVGGALVADANARVQESWSGLKRAIDDLASRSPAQLTRADINRLEASVTLLTGDLVHAQSQIGFLKLVSVLSPGIGARLAVVDLGREMGQGVEDTMAGAQPVLDLLLPDSSQRPPTTLPPDYNAADRVAESLQIGQVRFVSADSHYALVQNKLQALNYATLPSDLLSPVQELASYFDQFRNINKLLINGPDLISSVLGMKTGKNYLILSENNDQLRPSGGIISTFGYARIEQGQLSDFGYGPTTATSPIPPPKEMTNTITIPDWWLSVVQPASEAAWDASWYADFPTTAKMAAWYYENGNNPRSPVDGVIGIDITAFEYLLDALGSVKVADYNGEVVNAANFRQEVYRIREQGGDSPHKKFLASLYKQILSDWQTTSQQHGSALLPAVLQGLQQKHIMLYFKDDNLNQMAETLGWSGSQTPATDHDYVMVADGNVQSKSNSSIERQLGYNVDIQPDGSLKSKLSITYNFSAQLAASDPGVNPANYTDINYENVMQVYVPTKTVLTDSQNFQAKVDTVNDSKYTDFVSSTKVNYGSTQRYQLSYTTVALIGQLGAYHRYRLLLQKQSGMTAEPAEIHVSLPVGAQVISISPKPETSYNFDRPILNFSVQLKTDQWIDVIYSR